MPRRPVRAFALRGLFGLFGLIGAGVAAAAAAGSVERGPALRARPTATAAEAEARVIVKFKAGSALLTQARALRAAAPVAQHAQALGTRLGLALGDGRPIGARAQVMRASGMTSQALADRLAAQADVEYAVVDGRQHALAAPNDPLYRNGQSGTPAAGQWYLRAPSSATIVDATSVVSAINAEAAWSLTHGSASVVVAVLDTGVRTDHPDLAAKLRPGYDFIADTGVALDGDGRDTDPSDPGDFGCTTGELSSWHGTQTAGLIGAATNNGVGMAGSGRDVTMLPVRVLGKCGGFDSDIQAAMLWSAGLAAVPSANPFPARVVNLSLGSSGACSAGYRDVIAQLNNAGVVVVVAAGNDGLAVGTPANCPGAIAVAGVRHAGSKVGYSDLGPEVALAAPAGNCVNTGGSCLFPLLTTSNGGTTTPVTGAAGATYTSGGSDASLGTSFSAPLVAGTVALMMSANPTLSPAQVLAALKATARPFPVTGFDAGVAACTAPTATAQNSECYCSTSTCGAGLLDAGAAVAAVAVASAKINVASTAAVAGTPVALDGSDARAGAGASIAAYEWKIVSGAATFTSATNAANATLLPSAAGTVVASLTVTDSAGGRATGSVTLTVAAATVSPAAAPPAADTGGGGAVSFGWLFAWLAAIGALHCVKARRRP